MKKIFAYKNTVKLNKKQLAELADEGFLPIKVENLQDIKVIETFPDVDNTWLLTAAMDMIMESGSFNLKNDFGAKVLKHIRERYNDPKDAPTP
jgi:hypothetical protein